MIPAEVYSAELTWHLYHVLNIESDPMKELKQCDILIESTFQEAHISRCMVSTLTAFLHFLKLHLNMLGQVSSYANFGLLAALTSQLLQAMQRHLVTAVDLDLDLATGANNFVPAVLIDFTAES